MAQTGKERPGSAAGRKTAAELEELEKKYQAGLAVLEERVRNQAEELAEEGRQRLSDLQREKEALQGERKRTLQPLLQKSAAEISGRQEQIRFIQAALRDTMAMSPDQKGEKQERIRRLQEEIEDIKRACEQEAEKFDGRIKRLRAEEERVREEYLSPEVEKEIRRNSVRAFQEKYEKKKAALAARIQEPPVPEPPQKEPEPPQKEPEPPQKEPEPSAQTEQPCRREFLREFLADRKLPEKVFFPAKIGGRNLQMRENAGQCIKIFGSQRRQYEDAACYLLMQLMLRNIGRSGENMPRNILYYFNFGENMIRDAAADRSCVFGLSCCDKIQYVTPDTLRAGLEFCLEDLENHMEDHTVWIVFSGMEYMDLYMGYTEEEKQKIAVCYNHFIRYLSTGDSHVFLAGASEEACGKLRGTENIPVCSIDLDRKKMIRDQREEDLEMWAPLAENERQAFEECIMKY